MYLTGEAGGWRMQKLLAEYVETGIVHLHTPGDTETRRILALMDKYQDRPMDLADASLVALAEVGGCRRVFSIDSDFYVYRWRTDPPWRWFRGRNSEADRDRQSKPRIVGGKRRPRISRYRERPTRQSLLDKGKPVETRGRKTRGLSRSHTPKANILGGRGAGTAALFPKVRQHPHTVNAPDPVSRPGPGALPSRLVFRTRPSLKRRAAPANNSGMGIRLVRGEE